MNSGGELMSTETKFIRLENIISRKDSINAILIDDSKLQSNGLRAYRVKVTTNDTSYYPFYFDSEFKAEQKIESIFKELNGG